MVVTLVATLMLSALCVGTVGCDLLGTAAGAISSINPCGTILNCDPAEYLFLTSGYEGPGVDPGIDPFCVYPPFCDATSDPIFGGLGP
jgi:hypothetical protein